MKIPLFIHRFIISILYTLAVWLAVDTFLIDIPFWKYFIIEFLVFCTAKVLIFTFHYFGIDEDGE